MILGLLPILVGAALPAPLVQALQSARAHNHTLRISRAQLSEQQAEVKQAFAKLLPTLGVNGSYTRNQYQVLIQLPPGSGFGGLTNIDIIPYNQLSASVTLNVPLIQPTAFARYSEAKTGAKSVQSADAASEAQVLLSAARAYDNLSAAQGIKSAAETAVGTANQNLQVAQVRVNAGAESPLAVDRAKVDLARAQQTLATAIQTLGVARRTLETLTGEPAPADLPLPAATETRMSEEAYAAKALSNRPEVAQARNNVNQAEQTQLEAKLEWAPTLSGNVAEHVTNATSFVGRAGSWSAGVALDWNVDPFGTRAAIERANAQRDEARERLAQVQDAVRDDVHSAWLEVDADRARLKESQDEAASATEALTLTERQFRVGAATSLDVSSAQRDAFNAQANQAQSRANLASAFFSLATAAGEDLLEEK